MNILLVMSLIIIAGLGIYGHRRGFVRMAVPILSGIVSLIIFFLLKDWVLGFLFRWTIFGGEHILARIVVILLIYLAGTLAFKWLLGMLQLLTRLPLVHGVNKFLGALLGVIKGLLAVWLILYLIRINGGRFFGMDTAVCIGENAFLQFLYVHNLIEYLMTTLFGGWIA